MRLGRKLSEGFTVDREADAAAVAPDPVEDRTVPGAVEPDRDADIRRRPAVSGLAGSAER